MVIYLKHARIHIYIIRMYVSKKRNICVVQLSTLLNTSIQLESIHDHEFSCVKFNKRNIFNI